MTASLEVSQGAPLQGWWLWLAVVASPGAVPRDPVGRRWSMAEAIPADQAPKGDDE